MNPPLPLFDHHAHLDDPAITTAQIRSGLAAAGFVGGISAGYGPDRSDLARQRMALDPRLKRTVGLHPWWLAETPCERWEQAWRDVESELSDVDVVALGEIGLDQTVRRRLPLAQQETQLQRGLDLARQTATPVVLHIVRWHGHALRMLQAQPPPGGVLHRYGGPTTLVADLQRLGLYLSLDAKRWQHDPAGFSAVAQVIDAQYLLVETDWPDRPRDWSEALGEMATLIAALAELRAVPIETLAAQLVQNARRLYGLTQ